MAAEIQLLEHFFKRVEVNSDDDDGDDNNAGDCWEMKEPTVLSRWSLLLVPMTKNVAFGHAFLEEEESQHLSMDSRVIDVVHESTDIVKVHCATTGPDPYKYTMSVDNTRSPFSVGDMMCSLKDSAFESLLKDLGEEMDAGKWVTKDGSPLKAKPIASKLRRVLMSIAGLVTDARRTQSMMRPISIVTESENVSQASAGNRTSRP
jgi:hypothetical protein